MYPRISDLINYLRNNLNCRQTYGFMAVAFITADGIYSELKRKENEEILLLVGNPGQRKPASCQLIAITLQSLS
jgi:hypothetical protein